MKFDSYVINNNGIEKTIYPLMEFDISDKHYIIYSEKENVDLEKDLMFAGEIIGDDIVPVSSEKMKEVEEKYKQTLELVKGGTKNEN